MRNGFPARVLYDGTVRTEINEGFIHNKITSPVPCRIANLYDLMSAEQSPRRIVRVTEKRHGARR